MCGENHSQFPCFSLNLESQNDRKNQLEGCQTPLTVYQQRKSILCLLGCQQDTEFCQLSPVVSLDHKVGPDPDPKSDVEFDLEPVPPVVFDLDPDPKSDVEFDLEPVPPVVFDPDPDPKSDVEFDLEPMPPVVFDPDPDPKSDVE